MMWCGWATQHADEGDPNQFRALVLLAEFPLSDYGNFRRDRGKEKSLQ